MRVYSVLPAFLVVAAIVSVVPGPWPQTSLAAAAALALIAGILVATAFEAGRRAASPGRRTPQGPVKPWDEFWRELDRSRRHERQFTVLAAMKPESKDAKSEAHSMELRRVLRTVDTAWEDSERLYLLLPETGAAGAGAVAARLRRAMPDSASAKIAFRLVTFPDDAVTGRALLDLVRMPVDKEYARFRPQVTSAIAEAKVFVRDDDL